MSSKRWTLACAPIEDSDQSVHIRNLIRVYARRSMGNQSHNNSSYGKQSKKGGKDQEIDTIKYHI